MLFNLLHRTFRRDLADAILFDRWKSYTFVLKNSHINNDLVPTVLHIHVYSSSVFCLFR